MGGGRHIAQEIPQPVARQLQPVYRVHRVVGEKAGILLVYVKAYRLRNARRKVGAGAVCEREVLAPVFGVGRRVVVPNEASGPAHQVETHEFPPVVGVFRFVECRQGTDGCLVSAKELGLSYFLQQFLGPDSQVFVFRHEQAELA